MLCALPVLDGALTCDVSRRSQMIYFVLAVSVLGQAVQNGALLELAGNAAKVEFGGALTLIHNSTGDELVCSGKIRTSNVIIEGTTTTVADLIGEVAILRQEMTTIKQFVGMMPPPPMMPPLTMPPSTPPPLQPPNWQSFDPDPSSDEEWCSSDENWNCAIAFPNQNRYSTIPVGGAAEIQCLSWCAAANFRFCSFDYKPHGHWGDRCCSGTDTCTATSITPDARGYRIYEDVSRRP